MNIIDNVKSSFAEKYLQPQENKWFRAFDALSAVFCFVSAIIGLYFLQTQAEAKLPNVSKIVVYTYFIVSLPLANFLYKPSSLKKIERLMLVFFILASSMSLLISIMSIYR